MGVPLRGPCSAAAGAGLQGDAAAAELTGAVGSLAGRRRESGAQALPGQRRLPQGRQALPPQVVLLQVCSGSIYRMGRIREGRAAEGHASLERVGPEKHPSSWEPRWPFLKADVGAGWKRVRALLCHWYTRKPLLAGLGWGNWACSSLWRKCGYEEWITAPYALFIAAPSSMVIRDLTLRSAASFGSFHLIRLLYDEYMYYLIEHRVAQAKGETPIAVMGEVREVLRVQAVRPLAGPSPFFLSPPSSSPTWPPL